MIYLCNGFSSSMCADPRIKRIDEPLSKEQFCELLDTCEWTSAIGHESLANCLSKITGHNIERNRINLNVTYDDQILLVSVQGRLPENPTYVEYEGKLHFSLVRIEKQTITDIQKSIDVIEDMMDV